jgi:hypothetical protein
MMKKQGRPIVLTKSEKSFLEEMSKAHHRFWNHVVLMGRRKAMVKAMLRRGLIETKVDEGGAESFRLLPKGRDLLDD